MLTKAEKTRRNNFRKWCESKGMQVVSVRKHPKTGKLRAFLCNFYGPGRGNLAELQVFDVYLFNTKEGTENLVGIVRYDGE